MNIIWYVSDRNACGIVRADVPARAIGKYHHGEVCVVCKNSFDVSDIVNADVMVFQRACTRDSLMQISAAKQAGIPVVYDIDDDLFCVPEWVQDAHQYFSKDDVKDVIRQMLCAADVVTTSCDAVSEVVADRAGVDSIVVPNCIDIGQADLSLPKPVHTPRTLMGWYGSEVHKPDAKIIGRAVELAMDKHKHLHFSIRGNIAPGDFDVDLSRFGSRVQFSGWALPGALYDMTASYDFALCPVGDGGFNKAKSPIKLMECAATGTPCVVSNAEPYKAFGHGSMAMKASNNSADEWESHINWMVENPEARLKMGRDVRSCIEANFDNKIIAQQWLNVFRSLHG